MKSSLLRELENAKRNLQEVSSRIKSTEQLIEDEQADSLQCGADEEVTYLKSTIQHLEEEISTVKLNLQEAVSELHHKLAENNGIISQLEKELEDLQRQSVTDIKSDPLNVDYLHIQNKNQLLQDELNSIINTVNEEEKLLNEDLKHYEVLKKEINQVCISLAEKKNELKEKNEHIDILNEELLVVNTQKNFSQPMVSQIENTPSSTSLFSEVNERRITTQETLTSMKSNFLKIVDEQGKLHKKLSQLQCENSKLKLLYNTTALTLDDCKAPLKNSLKSQLRMLKELSKIHEEKLKGQEETIDCTTYKLFDHAMELVEAEVKLFKEKVSNWYLSEHMLSSSLFKINQEIEKLQKIIEILETENNRNKYQTLEGNATFDEETIVGDDNKHLQSNSQPIRRHLEAVNENIQGEECTSRLKGVTLLRGSDHSYSVDFINENPSRNVRFAENTVSRDSQGPNLKGCRGRKVFVLPKKH